MMFAPGSLLSGNGSSPDALVERPDDGTSGKLIIVSNRVAKPDEQHAGGLGHALANLLGEVGGTWIGWSGKTTDDDARIHSEHIGRVDYVTLDLPRAEFNAYYEEYSNGALWPLLHGRTDLVDYAPSSARGYASINERFADVIAQVATSRDCIWVQDYHLIPLGSLLRERGVRCRIGFFLHTPMPAFDVFAKLPGSEMLLRSLATYDLVGVQTRKDRDALCNALGTLDAGKLASVVDPKRKAAVRAFPIGVDPDHIAAKALQAQCRPVVGSLKTSLADRTLLIGVDRLDYSKGLPERVAAIAEFLRVAPEWRRRFTFLQVAPKTRDSVRAYRRLGRIVQRRVGEINGAFGDESWTPLRYVNRTYSQADLAGFYRLAKLGVVTPLCDGMNLVAKEYVAAQDEHDPGVLVLSEFAGAARELSGALIVNPFDANACAAAMQRGLEMPLGERLERHASDMRALRANTIHDWGHGFVDALRASTASPALDCAAPLAVADGPRATARAIARASSRAGSIIAPGAV